MSAPPRKSAPGTTPSAHPLHLGVDDIKALVSLVARERIHDFEFEGGGVKMRIRRDGSPGHAPAQPALSMPSQVLVASASASEGEGEEDEPGLHYITSPIVGTFYRSPSPSAPAYAQAGDFVRPGQVLCIVEAMKLMNEIECDASGELVRVLVENGQPVEFGQRLFAVRPR